MCAQQIDLLENICFGASLSAWRLPLFGFHFSLVVPRQLPFTSVSKEERDSKNGVREDCRSTFSISMFSHRSGELLLLIIKLLSFQESPTMRSTPSSRRWRRTRRRMEWGH